MTKPAELFTELYSFTSVHEGRPNFYNKSGCVTVTSEPGEISVSMLVYPTARFLLDCGKRKLSE